MQTNQVFIIKKYQSQIQKQNTGIENAKKRYPNQIIGKLQKKVSFIEQNKIILQKIQSSQYCEIIILLLNQYRKIYEEKQHLNHFELVEDNIKIICTQLCNKSKLLFYELSIETLADRLSVINDEQLKQKCIQDHQNKQYIKNLLNNDNQDFLSTHQYQFEIIEFFNRENNQSLVKKLKGIGSRQIGRQNNRNNQQFIYSNYQQNTYELYQQQQQSQNTQYISTEDKSLDSSYESFDDNPYQSQEIFDQNNTNQELVGIQQVQSQPQSQQQNSINNQFYNNNNVIQNQDEYYLSLTDSIEEEQGDNQVLFEFEQYQDQNILSQSNYYDSDCFQIDYLDNLSYNGDKEYKELLELCFYDQQQNY